ncbi:unnamed protein product [Schistosoma haematobium]|nr:unnamed protein product [Schistosoma haematobium]
MIETMGDFSSIDRSELTESSNMYLEVNNEPQFHPLWCILPSKNGTNNHIPYSTPCKENHRNNSGSTDNRSYENNSVPRISDVNTLNNCEQTVQSISINLSLAQNKSFSLCTSNDGNIPNTRVHKLDDTKLHQDNGVSEMTTKQTVNCSEIPVIQNIISPQFPTNEFSTTPIESQQYDTNNCQISSLNRMNGQTKATTTDQSDRQQNMSTEEVFPERHPSAQGSYQEEPFINTDYCSRFDVSGVDLKQASAIVNTVHTVNGVQQYTETNSDNCLLKHNHSYGTSDYKGNPNQYSCPQSELNISAGYPITSIHNTIEEHASLEISSETQRALESSNSTPPSTEKTDNHCQEKSNLLLTPSHHSPLTKTTLNNQMITSNWTKSGQWNTDCSVSNHQANERQNSYCFKKDTNEHVFLDYNDANSTVIQSPDAFTDDQTGHSIVSSDAQSSGDESDEGMSLVNFEHFTNSMQPNHAGLYFCHLCDFAGSGRQEFQDHLLSHYDYKCLKCDYTSRTEGRLKRHMKDFHSDVPPENFSGKTIRSIRSKLQRCKQCDFVTDTKDEFWRHLRIHIKEDKRLECHLCCFITEYKHHLEYHMRNHMGSKPYKCPKCNYECVNKSMLNSHMKSHSNVYPYRCANCNYATKYCHSLKLHLTKHEHKPAVVLNSDGSLPPYDNTVELMNVKRGPNIRHGNSKSHCKRRNSSESTKNRMKGSSALKCINEKATHVSTTSKCSTSENTTPNKEYQNQTMGNANSMNIPMNVNCNSSFNTSQSVSGFKTFVTTESNNISFSNSTLSTPILFPTFTSANNIPVKFMETVNSITSDSIPIINSISDSSITSSNTIMNSYSNPTGCNSNEIEGQCVTVTSDPFLNYSVSAYSSMVAFMAAMQCGDFSRAHLISSNSTNLTEFTDLNFTPSNSHCTTDSSNTISSVECCNNQVLTSITSSNCDKYIQANELNNTISNVSEINYPIINSSNLNTNTKITHSINELNHSSICSSSTTSNMFTTSNKDQFLQEKESLLQESMEIIETSETSCRNLEKTKMIISNKPVCNDFESALDLSSASCIKQIISCDKFHRPNTSEDNEQNFQIIKHEKNNEKSHIKESQTVKSSIISSSSSAATTTLMDDSLNNNNNNNNNKDLSDFTHECRFCEIRFRQRTLYDIHMGFHSHSDPYLCNRCGHQSNDSVEFFTHLGQEAHYS